MTQTLVAKLDQLQSKVEVLTQALAESRKHGERLQVQFTAACAENDRLRDRLEFAQSQVDDILTKWFPELEPATAEAANGNA